MFSPLFLAAGLIPTAAPALYGVIIAPAECMVAAARRQATTAIGNNIPLGAPEWVQHLDPNDEAPYAFDFRPLLLPGEVIVSIRRLRMPPAAGSLGVNIISDQRRPIIDEDSKGIVQLWFGVDAEAQDDPRADGLGIPLPISFWVRTNFFRSFERTAVLRERNQ